VATLIKHVHACLNEMKLTDEEWEFAWDFMERMAAVTGPERNEFLLFADVIGGPYPILGVIMNDIATSLVGTWRLVHSISIGADGKKEYPFGDDAIGFIYYSGSGIMAV
jgi:hypothetical protein